MSNKIAIICGVVASVLRLAAEGGPASAGTVDLSSYVNADLNNYNNGSVYPANGGPITIGGVQFSLASFNPGTGIVQASQWTGFTHQIAINQADVTVVYTVINSAFGTSGDTIGSLTFTGSKGATYTYDLVEGVNVRDHSVVEEGGVIYNRVATDLYASHDFGSGDVLDVQKIVLPSAFGPQTLTGVTFTGFAIPYHDGEPFLAALTTFDGAVPEPATWAMLILGVGMVGLAARRRRDRMAVAV